MPTTRQSTGAFATRERERPAVLLIDDGELDGVARILDGVGADFLHLRGSSVTPIVPRPRDLLVTSLQRALDLPAFEADDHEREPAWVCVHNQDFLPLRARLRDLGVHFLVHSAAPTHALKRFLTGRLYGGPERRTFSRLPLGIRVRTFAGTQPQSARLVDVSSDSCALVTSEELSPGTEIAIALPESFSGCGDVELQGCVVRTTPGRTSAGTPAHKCLVRLGLLDADVVALLQRILGGDQVGTPVSPLARVPTGPRKRSPAVERTRSPRTLSEKRRRAPAPSVSASPDSASTSHGVLLGPERRERPRWKYPRRVEILAGAHGESATGLDLSPVGVRIEGCPNLTRDAVLTLALCGDAREEPVIVDGVAVRGTTAGDVSLRFAELSDEQRDALDRLISGLEKLDSHTEDARWANAMATAPEADPIDARR